MNVLNSINNALSAMRDKFYIHQIKQDPERLYNIANPSKKVITALADIEPRLIPYIENYHADKLTEEVKLEMVQNNPDVILCFSDNDDKLISYVLKNHGDRLSEEAKFSILAQKPLFIGEIKNPSEKLQVFAVLKELGCITVIDTPCESAQRAAVDQDPHILSLIEPSENVCMYAVEKDAANIEHITNPSEKVQLTAVINDPAALKFIYNPSEKVMLASANPTIPWLSPDFHFNPRFSIEDNVLRNQDIAEGLSF